MSRQTAHFYINYNNIVVLKDYLDVLKEALEHLGYRCDDIRSMKGIPRRDLIVFPMGTDAFRYYVRGYHNFILWQQGATADESFLRNHSRLRYYLINFMDLFSMKHSRFNLYVSQYMLRHYEKIGGCNFEQKSYIMPCFNEKLDPCILREKDYSKKNFTYVGSLDLWQCFDQTADLYAQIERQIPDAFFHVLTFQVEEAKKILLEKGIKNFDVKCVSKEEVKHELKDCTYGFVIREDSIINRVATPTKISSYLAAGVLPVFSDCLADFAALSQKYKNMKMIPANRSDFYTTLDFFKQPLDSIEIQKEITHIFETYYCREAHVKNIGNRFLSLLERSG